MRKSISTLVLLIAIFFPSLSANQQRQIPITVEAKPAYDALTSGKPLLLRITISNGLPEEIRFSTFSLMPNSWNGETTNVSLASIYRRPRSMSVFYARPMLGELPRFIAGMASYPIKPHESLSVLIDMSKWQIVDGWKAGKYSISVRVDNIDVDQYTKASVTSDPVDIEIR